MTKTLAVIACLSSSLVLAQNVPGSITFNARLTDTGGAPITGSHTLGFGLYDQASGGAAVWNENVNGASFSTEGVAFMELGTVTPLSPATLDGRKFYLEVSVDGTTMSPRLAIVSVPYAIRASVAATAGSIGSLTAANIQQRVTGTCNPGQAVRSIDVSGGVTCENISAGGGGDITDVTTAAGSGLEGGNTTGAVALSLATCPSGQVLKSSGTAWACAADAVGTGDITGVTAGGGLTGGGATGTVTLALTACTNGQILKHNTPGWACAADATGAIAAGTGLSLVGSTLSVNFAGNGVATTAARSDHAHGTVYTRWGVNTCPTGATRIYAGFTAGAAYNHGGSGANLLCLASAPVWTTPTGGLLTFSDVDQNGGLIYGTEYEVSNNSIGWNTTVPSKHDRESVCAVCLKSTADNHFMYPGASTCPTGWTTEYYGYLMSSAYTQAKSEFICVDANATATGSVVNSNGALLYSVEAECTTPLSGLSGSALPCGAGQYVHNREITCSVCSQ